MNVDGSGPVDSRRRSGRRIGLVLGAGGTPGATWMIGALGAVQERMARPLGEVDLLLGTSAGSVLAAALRYGLTPDALVAHQRGAASSDLPDLHALERESGRLPSLPRFALGSSRLLAQTVRAPHRVQPNVAVSACTPWGRTEHHMLRRCVRRLVQSRGPNAPGSEPHGHAKRQWPERHTWIMDARRHRVLETSLATPPHRLREQQAVSVPR
jgi:NTE family protein